MDRPDERRSGGGGYLKLPQLPLKSPQTDILSKHSSPTENNIKPDSLFTESQRSSEGHVCVIEVY